MNNPLPIPFSKPTTLRDRVESYLRTAIMEGHFKGGDRLREQELCDRLNVSRPTLREALRTLEGERLIAIESHRGPTVIQLTEKTAQDLYAMRQLLEGYAAGEFARMADDQMIRTLGEAVAQLHHAAAQHDKSVLLAAKREFYEVLMRGCGNTELENMLAGLLSRINLLRAKSFTRSERLVESLVEIDKLYECIKRRDPEAARQAAQEHIEKAMRTALDVLRRERISEPVEQVPLA